MQYNEKIHHQPITRTINSRFTLFQIFMNSLVFLEKILVSFVQFLFSWWHLLTRFVLLFIELLVKNLLVWSFLFIFKNFDIYCSVKFSSSTLRVTSKQYCARRCIYIYYCWYILLLLFSICMWHVICFYLLLFMNKFQFLYFIIVYCNDPYILYT